MSVDEREFEQFKHDVGRMTVRLEARLVAIKKRLDANDEYLVELWRFVDDLDVLRVGEIEDRLGIERDR